MILFSNDVYPYAIHASNSKGGMICPLRPLPRTHHNAPMDRPTDDDDVRPTDVSKL